MANLSSGERKKIYPFLAKRDGEKCANCGKSKREVKILEIHEDIYERPLRAENMRLMCHGCNHIKELRKKNMLRTSSISAEHKKSMACYPLFIKWLESEMEKPENNFHIPYDQVVDQAAFLVGKEVTGTPLSPKTIERYLGPLCDHPDSPYLTMAGSHGQFEIWKRGHEPDEDRVNLN